jgi:hypothetical protein
MGNCLFAVMGAVPVRRHKIGPVDHCPSSSYEQEFVFTCAGRLPEGVGLFKVKSAGIGPGNVSVPGQPGAEGRGKVSPGWGGLQSLRNGSVASLGLSAVAGLRLIGPRRLGLGGSRDRKPRLFGLRA